MLVWVPTTTTASPAQEPPPGTGSDSTVEIDVDVATADVDDVEDTLDDVVDNVLDQVEQLNDARDELDDAEDDLEDARAAVTATQGRIDGLVALSDGIVTNTYVSPPTMANTDTLSSPTLGDLALKQALLTLRADNEGDVLDELGDARDLLDDQEAEESDAVDTAATARDDALTRLEDVQDAVGQKVGFIALIEERLERGAGESLTLEEVDPDLADAIGDDQDALADALQAIIDNQELADALDALADALAEMEVEEEPEPEPEPPPEDAPVDPPDLGAPSGSLATVDCPSGGSITVDSSLSDNLSSLLSAASSAGVSLCGNGYRDPQQQIDLRRQNCGTSDYAIYEMPASQCSPPTARPGQSMHEKGLAVDFENCSSRSTACYNWLAANAASYGMYNLPSEPWHWSTDGT